MVQRVLQDGDIWEASYRYGVEPESFLDFSTCANPLGPSPEGLKAVRRALNDISWYPDSSCSRLKEVLSEYLHVSAENIIVGNGRTKLLYLACRALRAKSTLIPVPACADYAKAASSPRSKVRYRQPDKATGFEVDLEEIATRLFRNERIILANPNNPTGRLIDSSRLASFVRRAMRRGVTVILDESFIDFVPEHSLVRKAVSNRRLLVLRSFARFFGAPGLRLGYGVGSAELIAELERRQEPFTVNALAQVYGAAALRDRRYIKRTKRLVQREREFLFDALTGIPGLRPFRSAANFVLVELMASDSASHICDALGEYGILVRECSGFEGLDDRFVRIAVMGRDDNERLVERLYDIVEERDPNAE